MPVNKRISLLLCMIMAVGMILGACSSKDEPQKEPANNNGNQQQDPGNTAPDNTGTPPEQEDEHEPVTITVMNWGGAPADFFSTLNDDFTAKYPWITVEMIASGGSDIEALSKLASMQSAGNPPDLVWVSSVEKWSEGGNLEDLKPYMDSDPVVPTLGIKEGFLESWALNGQVFAMPWSDDPWPLVINKDLMAKHGIEMPSNDWTYEDFKTVVKQATDHAAGEYGLSYNGVFKNHFAMLLPVANGHAGGLFYMNEDNTQSMLNTPEVLADLQWLKDLYTVDKVMMDTEVLNASGYGEGGDFIAGKALLSIAQPLIQLDDMVDFEWDILPAPRGTVTQANFRNTMGIAMTSASKHKEAAWLYLRFQFEFEANKWRIENIGFPSMVENAELHELLRSKYEGKNFEGLIATTSTCCTVDSPIIYDFNTLHDLTGAPSVMAMFNENRDLTSIIPTIEDYNKRAAEYWKSVGVIQ